MLVYLEIHRVHTPYVALQGRHTLRNSRRPCSGQWRPLQNTLQERFFFLVHSTLDLVRAHVHRHPHGSNSSQGTSPGLSSAAPRAAWCSNTKISFQTWLFWTLHSDTVPFLFVCMTYFVVVQSNTWLQVHILEESPWYNFVSSLSYREKYETTHFSLLDVATRVVWDEKIWFIEFCHTTTSARG